MNGNDGGWSDDAWLAGCATAGEHDWITVRAIVNSWRQRRKYDECSRCGAERRRIEDPNHLPNHDWHRAGRHGLRTLWVCDDCATSIHCWPCLPPQMEAIYEPCPRKVLHDPPEPACPC